MILRVVWEKTIWWNRWPPCIISFVTLASILVDFIIIIGLVQTFMSNRVARTTCKKYYAPVRVFGFGTGNSCQGLFKLKFLNFENVLRSNWTQWLMNWAVLGSGHHRLVFKLTRSDWLTVSKPWPDWSMAL